jgi:3-oxoacyl-[acyl-carrier protein] reductase
VGNVEQIRKMAADVTARFGRIDILVNNADLSDKTTLMKITPEQWDSMQRVNVWASCFVHRRLPDK